MYDIKVNIEASQTLVYNNIYFVKDFLLCALYKQFFLNVVP